MINDVDESLRTLLKRDVLNGANVEISFDTPNREWSVRRNTPTLNLYLYEIREDTQRREVQYEEVRNDQGIVVDRRLPPRKFKLSYLLTAWTQRPEDEHRLLSASLSCFIRFDALPSEVLHGELASLAQPVRVTMALPLPPERSMSDVWNALGGELKPSLDLVITTPFPTRRQDRPVGPPVLEEPRIGIGRPLEDRQHDRRNPRAQRTSKRTGPRKEAPATPQDEGVDLETDQDGTEVVMGGATETGRHVRMRRLNPP